MLTSLSLGDVIEVRTPEGLAYLQFTHGHPSYPEVVRALAGVHERRPGDLAELAAGQTRFVALFPLAAAVASGRLSAEIVTNAPVPPNERAYPTFRTAIRNKSGEIAYWWLWDGTTIWFQTRLEERQQDLPWRTVLTSEALMERLRTG